MMNNIVALGYGIVVLAILIGVGSIVLEKFGAAVGGTANTNAQYMLTQLGSAGLAGWTGAIIAASIGLLFLGLFMVGNERKK